MKKRGFRAGADVKLELRQPRGLREAFRAKGSLGGVARGGEFRPPGGGAPEGGQKWPFLSACSDSPGPATAPGSIKRSS